MLCAKSSLEKQTKTRSAVGRTRGAFGRPTKDAVSFGGIRHRDATALRIRFGRRKRDAFVRKRTILGQGEKHPWQLRGFQRDQ
jgi:hypothetical protein